MNKLKFRAFVKEDEKIYDVIFIDFDAKIVGLKMSDEQTNCTEDEIFEFNEVELMQCVGLKDANGKDAYEGDVISVYDEKYVIKHGEYQDSESKLFYCGHYLEKINNGKCMPLCCLSIVQISENIYTNKDRNL